VPLSALAVAACTASEPSPHPSQTGSPAAPAVLRVSAFLVSTHMNARGHMQRFHPPLTGYRVIASDPAGKQVETARVDSRGHALVTLAPGRYVLTLSLEDACYPVTVTAFAGRSATVNLPCAAP
jgi:hypothetical protein